MSVAVLLAAGLYLAICLPEIKNWQSSQIDKLLMRANQADQPTTKTALLEQAALLGLNDPIATEALANNLWDSGEYIKAINTYENSFLPINNTYLGYLALRADQASLAKDFFLKSNQELSTSESLAGLASTEYIAGEIQKGCSYAEQSKKLNLSSKKSENANTICSILTNKSNLSERAQIYKLLNSYLYALALSRLEALDIKGTGDWEAIAKIYANTGQLAKALDAANAGLAQNPTDQELLALKVQYLLAEGRREEAKPLQNQLEGLKFSTF